LREGTVVNTEKVTGVTGSSGKSDQRYTLANKDVVNGSITVFVYEDGVKPIQYRFVERVSDATIGERVFYVETTADAETVVGFGTTSYGFVPPQGSEIRVRYAYGQGAEGNIPAGSVNGFYSNTPDGVSVVSSSAFSGGTDEESIVSMRASLPSAISAQNRAVTEADFKNLALQVEGVAKAALSYSANTVTMYVHGAVNNFVALTDTSAAQDTTLEDRVESYVGERAVVGVSVAADSAIDYAQIYFKPKIYVNSRFVASWVKQDVANVIDGLFQFDRLNFGQTLSLGRLYSAILSVPGVDYVTVDPNDGGGYFSDNSAVLTTPATVQSVTVPYNELPKLHIDTGESSILSKIVVSGGIQGT
jgi:predicted phage baseplate assembly protein